MPLDGRRILGLKMPRAARPVEQLTPAIGAAFIEVPGAVGAKGAFHAANERTTILSRKVQAATFAIGAHFKHGSRLPVKWCLQKGEARGVTIWCNILG